MGKAETSFDALAEILPGSKISTMFGTRCYKAANGKAIAMLWKDCLVVKLSASDAAEALSLKGAQHFSPMDGRPMKEWIQIPHTHAARWPAFTQASNAIVSVMAAKKSGEKKGRH